jgi:oligoendopeptidase F
MSTTLTGAEEIHWDLSDIFSGIDDPAIEKYIEQAIQQSKSFRDKYYGKVGDLNASELRDAVAEVEEISSALYRAGAFSHLLYSTNTADPARGALLQRIQEKSTEAATIVLFFDLEWVALDDNRAEKILSDPAIEKYRHYMEAKRRFKPHVLSEPEEKVLAEKTVSGSAAWTRLFSELSSALTVELDGERVPLENALSRLHQPDRDVRRSAAEGVTKTLEEGLRTRNFIFNTLLLDKSTDDRLRNYPHWLASRNLSNEASDEAVQALVDAVVDRYDIPQRWYRLKAKLLGIDRLADYDRNATIASTAETMKWDEARDLVLESYKSFSPDAGRIISDFFERSWIDAAVTPNKVPGAYCMTIVPGAHPYVMMNFTGERRSALVLAHELGHGLHGYLSQDLGLFNSDTPLTLSETASVFGEALTFKRLLESETDKRVRLELIAGRIEDSIATVFRQIAMNRFEDVVHNARREKGELPTDAISDYWIETQTQMLADSVELTDGYRIWWSYIPHFIGSPGYVYAYAFGYLFSLAIYKRYEQEGEPMVEPYLDLLKRGGSDLPENLAQIVGLDITDPKFWHGGLEEVDALVSEAESLAE